MATAQRCEQVTPQGRCIEPAVEYLSFGDEPGFWLCGSHFESPRRIGRDAAMGT